MSNNPYRFGGPIPESVQRMKERRAKREENAHWLELEAKSQNPENHDLASALVELRAIRSSVEKQEQVALATFIGPAAL